VPTKLAHQLILALEMVEEWLLELAYLFPIFSLFSSILQESMEQVVL